MKEPMLIFETDPQLGTPVLTPLNGAGKSWTQKDLHQLEDELCSRYEGFVREGSGTLLFKGQKLHVKKKDGDTSRQPTLELWAAEPSPPRQTVRVMGQMTPPTPAGDWWKGFLDEIEGLFADSAFSEVLPPEKAMLQLVRNELQGMVEKQSPADLGLLVLVAILRLAEQVSRSQRPHEPHPYTYALSGVERLLSQTGESPRTPWGNPPATPNDEQPPSWLGRVWTRLTEKF